ncbi:MAG: hypothetical protein IPM45_04520 [Acidimicrobiales bacterium]|nr:hypothetical protein [Acidimicrobiales bacterium]
MGRTLSDVLADVLAAPPPPVSPDALRSIRAALDDALTAVADDLDPAAGPLRLPKGRVSEVLACERAVLANLAPRPVSEAARLGRLLDRVAAHLVLGGDLGEPGGVGDALGVARDALCAEDDPELLAWVDGLGGPDRERVRTNLAGHAESLAASLGVLDPAWWPRCESRATVTFAGGRIVAGAAFDLVLGGRPTGRPTVLVELKSGPTRPEHRQDVFWYALLCALRDGEAPAVVATWSGGDATVVDTPVAEGVLESAARRVIDAAVRLTRLASGGEPDMTPSGRCRWCRALPRCTPGTLWVDAADADPYGLGEVWDDDADDAEAAAEDGW